MTDASERERLAIIAELDDAYFQLDIASQRAIAMLRADAETIRGLTEMRAIFERQWNVTCEQLAAQSAELERVRKDASALTELCAEAYTAIGQHATEDQDALFTVMGALEKVDYAKYPLAAHGADTQGYKEPSEAQMFGGDLYSGIKP